MTEQKSSTNVLIIAATAAVITLVAAITLVAVLVQDSTRATTMIGLIAAPVTSLIGFLVLMARLDTVKGDVEQVKDHTEAMTNGLGDAKTRAAVADVLRPDLIDPTIREQLVADRRRQAAAIDASEVLLGRAAETPDLD